MHTASVIGETTTVIETTTTTATANEVDDLVCARICLGFLFRLLRQEDSLDVGQDTTLRDRHAGE